MPALKTDFADIQTVLAPIKFCMPRSPETLIAKPNLRLSFFLDSGIRMSRAPFSPVLFTLHLRLAEFLFRLRANLFRAFRFKERGGKTIIITKHANIVGTIFFLQGLAS